MVIASPLVALFGFAAVIVLLLYLIARRKWHVFFALLVPIIFFGILPEVDRSKFIIAFETGFGKTLGKIGVVIVLGSIMAEALKHTGLSGHYGQARGRVFALPGGGKFDDGRS
jgi:GntP family gluconate:H+ symporter